MKKTLVLICIMVSLISHSQSLIQSVNSGSIIGSNSSVSIGNIVVVPVNPLQSNSGIIGILVQINQQTLEVSEFELAENIIVYPNPTIAKINFQTNENLQSEKVSIYNELGKIVYKSQINSDNSLDLNNLSSGFYLIQFENKKLKTFKIIKH